MTQNSNMLQDILKRDFEKFEAGLNGEADSYLNQIRKSAFGIFNNLGFPHKKLEAWKYTNLNKIIQSEFQTSTGTSVSQDDINPFLIPELDCDLIVLVNGEYNSELSKISDTGEGIFIGSITEGISKHEEIFNEHFAKITNFNENSLSALNTAFANNGVFIYAGKDVQIPRPVYILNLIDARSITPLAQPRNLFVADESSSFKVVEAFHTIGDEINYTNALTEIFCGKNSGVEYYKIQDDSEKSFHTGSTDIKQARDSRFSATTITWGGSIIRNNLNILLDDENIETHMYGLFYARNKEHIDNQTFVDHAKPNCESNELYKGLIDDDATGVFNGKIMVREDAQKTNAYQSNNNILLSDNATIYAKPQLEIFADDVKCSHGATTGQLDKEALFYLRSRAVSENEARILLLNAYVSDVIDSITIEKLHDRLKEVLIKKLNREA